MVEKFGFYMELQKKCEKLHLYALKKILGIDLRTPNDLVYGELNRYPILVNFIVNVIRYWFKILEMVERRLPKEALLRYLEEKRKKTWATNVRLCLVQNGFGYVWFSQTVGNICGFQAMFN